MKLGELVGLFSQIKPVYLLGSLSMTGMLSVPSAPS